MPKIVKPLTAKQVENAKMKSKQYTMFDGGGMYLEVTSKGAKRWRLKYRFDGKDKRVSLGLYPAVSLVDARIKRDEAKAELAKGVNPFIERTLEHKAQAIAKKEAIDNRRIFKDIAETYLVDAENNKSLSETYIVRIRKSFKADIFPVIGNLPATNIEPADIGDVVMPMINRGSIESARKTFYTISKIFKVTISKDVMSRRVDKLTSNPCSLLDTKTIFGEQSDKHYNTIDIRDNKKLGSLLNSIDAYTGAITTRLALKMIAHTFVRPYNIRFAKWSQIDFENKQWIIPKEDMKVKKGEDFVVPLTETTLSILEDAKSLSDEYIFPSLRHKTSPMSDNAMVSAIKRMIYIRGTGTVPEQKYEIVAHSFRGIFSTRAHKESSFKYDVIEEQLAHSVGNKVERSYNHATYEDERKELMEWWSNYLNGLQDENNK